MLEIMQKEAAIEIVADLRARVYHYEREHGKSEETQQHRKTLLDFKERVKTDSALAWSDVFAFSKRWLEKYPGQ